MKIICRLTDFPVYVLKKFPLGYQKLRTADCLETAEIKALHYGDFTDMGIFQIGKKFIVFRKRATNDKPINFKRVL